LVMARQLWAPVGLWVYGVKLEITGRHHVEGDRPIIFVSNHSSYIDVPCLFMALPVNLHFIAKKQLKQIPILGWFMAATGMIFIDRDKRNRAIQSLEKAVESLQKGSNMIVFPEGSRIKGGQLGHFKKGAFHLAVKSKAKIIPVAIEGANKVWKKPGFKIYPGKVKLSIGAPIVFHGFSVDDLNPFVTHVRTELQSLMQQ